MILKFIITYIYSENILLCVRILFFILLKNYIIERFIKRDNNNVMFKFIRMQANLKFINTEIRNYILYSISVYVIYDL